MLAGWLLFDNSVMELFGSGHLIHGKRKRASSVSYDGKRG